MEVLYGYRNAAGVLKDPVAAIGIFDGVHIGHRKVISRLLRYRGRDRVIVTFDPHPRQIVAPGRGTPRIMSLEHRLAIFGKLGVDAVVVINFTPYIASMQPEDFVKKVLVRLGAKKVYVGGNFYFGRKKTGDVGVFVEKGDLYGIDVEVVNPVKHRGKVISSTWLRELISSGELVKAEKLLRRPVSLLGTVVRGDKRGRYLGTPTANIDPHHEVIPPPAVYAVKVGFDGRLYDGVLNIGFKPTFYGRKLKKRKEPRIEVHLLDFEGDVYGHPMEIFFIKRLRKERKFRSERDLISRIRKDILMATSCIANYRGIHKINKYKKI